MKGLKNNNNKKKLNKNTEFQEHQHSTVQKINLFLSVLKQPMCWKTGDLGSNSWQGWRYLSSPAPTLTAAHLSSPAPTLTSAHLSSP
jgi:hypothetical protein